MSQLIHKHDFDTGGSKEWTVPAAKVWRLDWAHVIYVSSATAGNREIALHVHDSAGVTFADYHAGATQAASQTRHYSFQSDVPREGSFSGSLQITVTYPDGFLLMPGQTMHFFDYNAVDAAGDTAKVHFQITEFTLGEVTSQ